MARGAMGSLGDVLGRGLSLVAGLIPQGRATAVGAGTGQSLEGGEGVAEAAAGGAAGGQSGPRTAPAAAAAAGAASQGAPARTRSGARAGSALETVAPAATTSTAQLEVQETGNTKAADRRQVQAARAALDSVPPLYRGPNSNAAAAGRPAAHGNPKASGRQARASTSKHGGGGRGGRGTAADFRVAFNPVVQSIPPSAVAAGVHALQQLATDAAGSSRGAQDKRKPLADPGMLHKSNSA